LLYLLDKAFASVAVPRGLKGDFGMVADDLKIWISSCNLSALQGPANLILRRVTEWLSRNGIALSAKSKAIVLTSDNSSHSTRFPELAVNVGGVSITPDNATIPKILGVEVDPNLRFKEYAEKIEREMLRAIAVVKEASRFLKPALLRIVALALCASKTHHFLEVVWPMMGSAGKNALGHAWNAMARAITRTMATAPTAACLAEAGLRPLNVFAGERALRFRAYISRLPARFDLIKKLSQRADLPPTTQQNTRIVVKEDEDKTRVAPRVAMQSPLQMPGIQKVVSLVQPFAIRSPAEMGRAFSIVSFVLPKSGKRATQEVKLEWNSRIMEMIPPGATQYWGDGGVLQPTSMAPTRTSAAAAIGFGAAANFRWVGSTGHAACSYSAEQIALEAAADNAASLAPPTSPSTPLFFGNDSLSNLRELAAGPARQTEPRLIKVWEGLCHAVEVGWQPIFLFFYSHTNVDSPNDEADKVCTENLTSVPSVPLWSQDVARDEVASKRRTYDDADSTKKEMGFRGEFIVRPNRFPIHEASILRSNMVYLMQMRVGVCRRLGGWRHELPDPCPCCALNNAMTRGGGAVRHFFSCPMAAELRKKWNLSTNPKQLWDAPARVAGYFNDFLGITD
jgi:hypothetical protein